MTPVALSVADGMLMVSRMASLHFLGDNQDNIIPPNNNLNMTNVMVSLMAPSASCHRKHAIAMYMPKN